MMLSAGSYKIVNHRVKVENQTLLLSERKRGFTAKKPKNFCYLNKYIVYCSSFYPVSLNLPDSWEVLSFEELNKLGIYFFKMEFEGFYYLVKIDIKTGLFELSEDKEKNRKAG